MKEFDQVNRDLEVRDLYNLEDAFHMSKDYGGAYRVRREKKYFLPESSRLMTVWIVGKATRIDMESLAALPSG
jgi:hypothetical protein